MPLQPPRAGLQGVGFGPHLGGHFLICPERAGTPPPLHSPHPTGSRVCFPVGCLLVEAEKIVWGPIQECLKSKRSSFLGLHGHREGPAPSVWFQPADPCPPQNPSVPHTLLPSVRTRKALSLSQPGLLHPERRGACHRRCARRQGPGHLSSS